MAGPDKNGITGDTTGAFSGTLNASLSGFALSDNKKRTLLGWQNATVETTRIDSAKRQLALGPVRIEGLASEVRLEDTGHNLKALLPVRAAPSTAPKAEKSRRKTAGKDTRPWRIERASCN